MKNDLTGQIFGAWKVIGFSHYHTYPSGQKRKKLNCKCTVCNNISLVGDDQLHRCYNNKYRKICLFCHPLRKPLDFIGNWAVINRSPLIVRHKCGYTIKGNNICSLANKRCTNCEPPNNSIRTTNTSKYRGVSIDKRAKKNKYRAEIRKKNLGIHWVKFFSNKKEAIKWHAEMEKSIYDTIQIPTGG